MPRSGVHAPQPWDGPCLKVTGVHVHVRRGAGEAPPVVFQVSKLQEVSWEKRRKQRQISAAAGSDPQP